MSEYQRRIVYLSDAQKDELFANGSVTVDDVTINYSESDIYVTPQVEGVTDVKVGGTSVVDEQGVANIPEIPYPTVTITDTNPIIMALSGFRYICGEAITLSIIPPTYGVIDVIFESGSTPTVLTITPPTGKAMKWTEGFNPTMLESDAIYEITIRNGYLASVLIWT